VAAELGTPAILDSTEDTSAHATFGLCPIVKGLVGTRLARRSDLVCKQFASPSLGVEGQERGGGSFLPASRKLSE
jgi:hypothetical protein